MANWFNLATVSALLTIITFLAQVLDLFPRYRELRKTLLFVVFGFFAGSLLTALTGVRIELGEAGSPLLILMTGTVLCVVLFLFLGVMAETNARKIEFYSITSASGGLFFLLLFIYGISGTTYSPPKPGLTDLTLHEQVMLAEQAQRALNYDRSIMFLETATAGMPDSDPRLQPLQQRLAAVKQAQMQHDLKAVR